MVRLTIDGIIVECPEGTTIMDAAASVGIPIPHLCYLKGVNEIAACRVCVVEIKGRRGLTADEGLGDARFPLLKGLAHADDGDNAVGQSGTRHGAHCGVRDHG